MEKEASPTLRKRYDYSSIIKDLNEANLDEKEKFKLQLGSLKA